MPARSYRYVSDDPSPVGLGALPANPGTVEPGDVFRVIADDDQLAALKDDPRFEPVPDDQPTGDRASDPLTVAQMREQLGDAAKGLRTRAEIAEVFDARNIADANGPVPLPAEDGTPFLDAQREGKIQTDNPDAEDVPS